MPISIEAATQHVNTWSKKLGSRGYWAHYLFFAADAITAAEIIKSGRLQCRTSLGVVQRDIANQDAIAVNPAAHGYVRLYFRPRTAFHLRTEGIKLLSDNYRQEYHMSLPIMFVLRLPSIVTLPGTCFANRKMAHAGMLPGNDIAYFSSIDFEKVYHDGAITDSARRAEIHDIRMAEVLIPDELPLADHLECIVTRTHLDALSLSYLVGQNNDLLNRFLRPSTRPAQIFFCWGAYIEELDVSEGVISFRVKSSRDYILGRSLKFSVQRRHSDVVTEEWRADQPLTGNATRIRGFSVDPEGHWRIEIEDALAFIGNVADRRQTVFGGS